MKFLVVFAALIALASANALYGGLYGGYVAPVAYAPVAKYAAVPAVTSVTTQYNSGHYGYPVLGHGYGYYGKHAYGSPYYGKLAYGSPIYGKYGYGLY